MLFSYTAEYTSQSVAALVANPKDRTSVAAAVAQAAGGKLISMHITLGGTTGIMVIFDAPDAISAGAVGAAASASGAFQNVQIKRLLTQDECVSVLTKAQGVLAAFSPPKA